jgi:hypothetical protein
VKKKGKHQAHTDTLEQRLHRQISKAYRKLESIAAAGSEQSEDDLQWLRWSFANDFHKALEEKARAGKNGSPAPIKTLFQTADWLIPLLLWLAENRGDAVKQYAKLRWSWPGYFHLLKREQNRYEKLLPEFNQAGTKVVKESPIGLGTELTLNLNARRTELNKLLFIAANAIYGITKLDNSTDYSSESWMWLEFHDSGLSGLAPKDFIARAKVFLTSLGPFNRRNWRQWKPIFDTNLNWRYGPMEDRFNLMPKRWQSNFYTCWTLGLEIFWFNKYRKARMTVAEQTQWLQDSKNFNEKRTIEVEPPLFTSVLPEVKKITDRRKKDAAKWVELKREILTRIYNLAH